jgi:hypothetical protein
MLSTFGTTGRVGSGQRAPPFAVKFPNAMSQNAPLVLHCLALLYVVRQNNLLHLSAALPLDHWRSDFTQPQDK